jgi:hypothetical protein
MNSRLSMYGVLSMLGLLLIGLAGCGESSRDSTTGTSPVNAPPIPPTEVANALRSLCDQMQSQVNNAAMALEQISPTNDTRRRTLRWRIQTAEICSKASNRDNALAGLIELWYWTVTSQVYFTTGSGKNVFGANQTLVVERVEKLSVTAEKMVRRAVPPERFNDLEKQIRAASADGDAFLSGDPQHANPLGTLLEVTKLESLLNLTLSPFDAFSGVKAGGDAAEHLAVTADRAVVLMANYPQLIDWHLQAAVLELQSQDTIQALLAEVHRSNASIEAALALARDLPAEIHRSNASIETALTLVRELPAQVRKEGVALLDQSRPAQADVRDTLRALTEAATALERLNTGVDQLIGRFTPVANVSPGTAPITPAPVDGPPARPFDIREYTAALNAATSAAKDLREMVSASEQLLASPAIPARLTETKGTAQNLIAIIAAWVIAVLVIATACVVVGVRLLRR